MSRSRKRWRMAMVCAVVLVSGCRKTTLELTAHGGFAYVRNTDGTVEVGFLKSVKTADCNVPQLGADLRIDDGRVVQPANAPTTFDVSHSVIRIDGLGTSGVGLSGQGLSSSSAPPLAAQPSPRTHEDDWKDMFWVPRTRLHYSSTRVDPNWRTAKVDGRLVLAGGSLSGGSPSDGAAVNGIWEFKRESDQMSVKQAITDRTRYSTRISASQVVINLTGPNGVTKLVVEPLDPQKRRTVGIILTGRHASTVPVKIDIGDPIVDFCAFYEMLETVPAKKDKLIPHFAGVPAVPGAPQFGQPTPGLFCPGDWP